jgi:Cu2+-exporting ATPase
LYCNTPVSTEQKFCCSGCEEAYGNIEEAKSEVQEQKPFFSVFAVQDSAGHYSLTLSIKNIHCAACVQRVERGLYEHEAVLSARVNMSTDRLTYSWKGAKEYGDILANAVIGLGYDLVPFGALKRTIQTTKKIPFTLPCRCRICNGKFDDDLYRALV